MEYLFIFSAGLVWRLLQLCYENFWRVDC